MQTQYVDDDKVSALYEKIVSGEEITLKDLKIAGDISGGKVLYDAATGIASLPLLLAGLGARAGLTVLRLGPKAATFLGVGGTFATTEGLSQAQSVHDLTMDMSRDELMTSPMFRTIKYVISEKFPNASEAEIEGFAQAQMANQLAFEYGAKTAAFSLLTEGGVASFAFGRFKIIF